MARRFEYDDRRGREYGDVDVRLRERSRERVNVPAWMRPDDRRVDEGRELVLRAREVETLERAPPPRSPSQVRIERIVREERTRSPSPTRRVVVRQSSRPPAERVRIVAPRHRSRSRSRSRSSSPDIDRIRIVQRKEERLPSPAPRPPTPKIIKGPTIEREVITHYRDIDHGMVPARPPSPPPVRQRDTEIDIYSSRGRTEVDVRRERVRSVSRERPVRRPVYSYDDDVVVQSERKHLQVDISSGRRRSISQVGRRAHSAAPPAIDYDSEAEMITKTIDARGRMGEARNGATRDWTIVDVPPGTERVRMDGAGGASAEVTWQKYSGVRRTKFIPDRDRDDRASTVTTTTATTSLTDLRPPVERERRLSVHVVKEERGRSRDRSPPRRTAETWTEITKDLVCREAIEECGYQYEETEWFYYIVEYLSHEDVVRLVNLSDRIRASRAARAQRARELAWEREWRDYHDHHHRHRSRSRHRLEVDYTDDNRVVEHEVTWEKRHHHDHRY
ncbi:hypothetical protein VTJ49DRAFT_2403 [Mycothermus thermophilus]|uniref:DUF8035 domain-containing protein n=1 Tax=Humicola insolens TaxID=85995 RepID=A0ABR3VN20_HUMIN